MLVKLLQALGLALIVMAISGCNDDKVLDNLTQEQANQVLSLLQQHNISAAKSGTLKSGYSITVSPAENTAALSVINQYQLPWAAEVQIGNAFPDSALVSSPNAEQARIRSLQEQRLEQSLRIISQVVNARVHISYPSLTNDMGNKKSISHVGILITYKGDIDENLFISQIKSFIKNSLDDIRYENISVVLFHAQALQYAPPLNIEQSTPTRWFSLLAGAIVLFIALLGLFFYKYRHQKPVTKPSALADEESVENTK